VSGDWLLKHYEPLQQQVNGVKQPLPADVVFDFSRLGALDTAGATLLLNLMGSQRWPHLSQWAAQLSPERRALLQTVADGLQAGGTPVPAKKSAAVIELLAQIGQSVEEFWQDAVALLNFMGLTLIALVTTLWRPSRWRVTALVANIEQIGLNAVPIVALLTFMVGAVIAFLGATVLANFGATIYTVKLVVFSFLREFAVLLTAILIAGRTASAFTAQIGLMKANEEIDALRSLGLSPVELIVLPRVLALLIVLPLLTFLGMIFGILGGVVVCANTLDISPTLFFTVMQDGISARHFWIGIGKAPLFAFLIAVIGCLEGFKVTGSAASVGEHTTNSVVHSLFVVILLDAVVALFLMEMGW
ncbi:MAG: MlaE family ABC transporter permease, partial [Enterobacteriaceae bacterium]